MRPWRAIEFSNYLSVILPSLFMLPSISSLLKKVGNPRVYFFRHKYCRQVDQLRKYGIHNLRGSSAQAYQLLACGFRDLTWLYTVHGSQNIHWVEASRVQPLRYILHLPVKCLYQIHKHRTASYPYPVIFPEAGYKTTVWYRKIRLSSFSSAESNRELGSQLLERLRADGLINVDRLFDGVKLVSEQKSTLDSYHKVLIVGWKWCSIQLKLKLCKAVYSVKGVSKYQVYIAIEYLSMGEYYRLLSKDSREDHYDLWRENSFFVSEYRVK